MNQTTGAVVKTQRSLWWGRTVRLGAAVGLVLLGVGAARFLPDTRSVERPPAAYALLRVCRPEPILGDVAGFPSSPDDFAAFRRNVAAAVRSRPVLLGALKRDEVKRLDLGKAMPDPLSWLEANLRVDFQNDSDLLRVGLDGYDAAILVPLVKAVVASYLEEIESTHRQAQMHRFTELEKAYAEQRETLKRKKQDLARLTKVLGLDTPSPDRLRLLSENMQDCSRELRKIRLARRAVEARERADAPRSKEEIAVLQAQEKLLTEEMKEGLEELHRPRVFSPELETARSDLATTEEIVRQMAIRLERLRVELRRGPLVCRFADAEWAGTR
jgi:hypothetical protein